MNPWDIIGWVIVLGLCVILAAVSVAILSGFAQAIRKYLRYRSTRKVPPKAGQVWTNGDKFLYVRTVYENGRIALSTNFNSYSGMSWSESPEEWAQRLAGGLFWLDREE